MTVHALTAKTKKAINYFSFEQLYRGLNLPNLSSLESLANATQSRFGARLQEPSAHDLDRIEAFFRDSINNNQLSRIEKKNWKNLCWVLWRNKPYLTDNNLLLDEYKVFFQNNLRSRLIKNLIFAYLRFYDPDNSSNEKITRLINASIASMQSNGTITFWRDLNSTYDLFHSSKCREGIWRTILNQKNAFQEFESSTNFGEDILSNGLIRHSFIHYSNWIKENISIQDNQNKIVKLLIDWSQSRNNSSPLRYGGDGKIIIEALLMPWSQQNPPAKLQQEIQDYIIKYFKDPRLSLQSWMNVHEDAKRVMQKWLAKQTLEKFFSFIDKEADKDTWKYRRKFWLSYYEKDYIKGAWFALGRQTQRHRDFIIEDDESFASAELAGAAANQSVLLLEIGDLIITEWSHGGACIVWDASIQGRPNLYHMKYESAIFRGKEEDILIKRDTVVSSAARKNGKKLCLHHHSSIEYGWQSKLADVIEYKTGIKIPKFDYTIGRHD